MLNIEKEVAQMERSTVDQLRTKYADVFGEVTSARNKQWLIKRIAWRMQANEEGDLSVRARKRAFELANDADIRSTPPRPRKHSGGTGDRTKTTTGGVSSPAELMPGVTITRVYKGQTILVRVLETGFEYQGERYRSLTGIAKVVTGKHWNGHHFFGLRNKGGKR